MTGFQREQKIKTQHKGMIGGVYVSSTYRGQGIAKELLSKVSAINGERFWRNEN
ncbi:GNAT family acetyltransferase [Paenibacillus terrae HPL-003]|uniref:GNAT family acetyltransferase n=2 Tax=Paenibacillus terrae TaxID=159743 RepID=G7VZ97_PAETH|nr:GNAT family N-acetyltransferase [Paenibacillus terrae]AET60191.1 GNAT family acetyltransferase [Paenibacillus terrae HPL-003]